MSKNKCYIEGEMGGIISKCSWGNDRLGGFYLRKWKLKKGSLVFI